MNRIEAIGTKSKYVPEKHLVLTVDGVPLDELVDRAIPGSNMAGQVSSLLGWLQRDEDNSLAWQRILPKVGRLSYAPILICPDDLDFTCGVVIAEVVAKEGLIRWDRIGLDASEGSVGSCVRWLPDLGPFRFSRVDYQRCLTAFKQHCAQT